MRRNRAGFTLIEMLITAAILASVLITAGTFLITSNRSQRAAVDLGSSVDTHAFVASILNYDFRIACYGISDELCAVKIDLNGSNGSLVEVRYLEDRFGESVVKEITWAIQNDSELVRVEEHKPGGFQTAAVVLRDVQEFHAEQKPESRQLTNFHLVRGDETTMNFSVAILNPIAFEGP